MYPLLRFAKEVIKFRRAPRIDMLEAHVSTHRCWPWDLDPWIELNNGRTLTLYDLGRLPMIVRTGMVDTMKANRWGITVAGNSVRYRRRIRAFDRFTMVSRVLGWDARFLYMEQSMWRKGECCNHMLLRGAITSENGILAPAEMLKAAGRDPEGPPLPGWVQAWIAADAQRPWPPELPAIKPAERNSDLPA
ncbi:Acyl-CoA thioesterase FadM [Paracoccus halophilus]|uniref:Acyl-CoA thioesterase FadM n=1 Tax=Paracoccus halophilus TaxID=376733 RepID=A0A099EYM4_9RHOB|nr:acyl-CoA thioesterase [Paracoccus halophilus]KGJ03344.1 thioeseterase [Paracoccus halophilus]SFA58787.1 Acyl-CoA thioesterase FadM [Paracoccus halophilus]